MALPASLEDVGPAWVTAIGTGIAYLVLLFAMFVLLFVVPYLLFIVL